MKKSNIHPKVAAATGSSALVGALIVIAASFGVTVAPALAAALIVVATFVGGYLKSSGIVGS
jgi:hypothetical protein